ncbi:MAG: hypothetical protein D6820_04905, partial [Lentisphaerae bacterium]
PHCLPKGFVQANGRAGLVRKRLGKGQIIYSAAPLMPATLLRNILRDSGVHLYCEEDCLIYANSRFVGVGARRDGTIAIRLPQTMRVSDPLSREDLVEGELVELTMRYGEFRYLRLDSVE